MLVGAGLALALFLIDAPSAMAQLVQSDVEAEPGATETTQLVTSSTEVRRAVIGLISLAVIVALLGILYWYKTGRLAAERHAHRYGGKHGEPTSAVVGQPSAPVPGVRTDMAGSSFAVPVRSDLASASASPANGAPALGGYGTWSTAPAPPPGSGPALMGYSAGASTPPQTAHPAPPQMSAPNPRPVWQEQGSAGVTQARPSAATVAPAALPNERMADGRSVPMVGHRAAPPQRSAQRVQDRQADRPPQAPTAAQQQPPQPPPEREPSRSTQSPYPDASMAAPSAEGDGLWSTLRRDLFG